MSKALRAWLPRLTVALAVTGQVNAAWAQRGKVAPKPPPAAPPPTPAAPATPEEKPKDLLSVTAGGLTAEQAGQRARGTSPGARAAEQNQAAASARTTRAVVGYIPRLVLLGRYTRLSNFTPPLFGGGAVLSDAPPGTVNPPNTIVSTPSPFPFFVNQWFTQAAVTVPITDYFFTIGKAHAAATELEEAAQFDTDAARARAFTDGKLAYYAWLRARGALNVAQQTLAVAKAHLRDSEILFNAGSAPKADVLRSDTATAAAEVALERARANVATTERQVRTLMHAKDEEVLEPGEHLDTPAPAVPSDVQALVREALTQRPEMKSLQRSADGTRHAASAARGARYPALSAFGEVTYANPNPRKFPATQEWFPTWSVGAQVTWSPNDFVGGTPAGEELDARAAAFEAQRDTLRDSITVEVVTAYQGVVQADAALTGTERQVQSATEGYRVARELYVNGRGTSTTLIDAETALEQARLDNLNARIETRTSRVLLDRALGRDTRVPRS